jgi:hypothetical protein
VDLLKTVMRIRRITGTMIACSISVPRVLGIRYDAFDFEDFGEYYQALVLVVWKDDIAG